MSKNAEEICQINRFLRVKNSLRIGKRFYGITDKELKVRNEKIKREIKELLHQSIIVSKDDMDKFE